MKMPWAPLRTSARVAPNGFTYDNPHAEQNIISQSMHNLAALAGNTFTNINEYTDQEDLRTSRPLDGNIVFLNEFHKPV